MSNIKKLIELRSKSIGEYSSMNMFYHCAMIVRSGKRRDEGVS